MLVLYAQIHQPVIIYPKILSYHSDTLITGECGWNCKVHVSHAEDKRCMLIIKDERINM